MISPPLREPIASQTGTLIEFLVKRTLPSAIRTLTPPGCRLLAVEAPPSWVPP